MSKVRFYPGLLIILFITGCTPAPDVLDADGHEIRFSDYQGRWLVINYWAEWCGPCREEIPELNNLHAVNRDKLRVIGVNFDNPDLEELRRQMTALDVQFPVLQSDPWEQLGYPYPNALPTTYILDPQGQLTHTLVGPQTEAAIEALIGES